MEETGYNLDAIRRMMEEAPEEPPVPQPREPEERIVQIPISELVDFPPELHKYHPATGERMEELQRSIRENGILNALLVRKLADGRYQIIAGHNRRTAAQAIGYTTVPCIVKLLPEDDDAVSAMNADNLLHRELLPSERGWAYRQEWEIRQRRDGNLRGKRTDLTFGQPGQKSGRINTRDEIAEDISISSRNLQRYIRLTYLIPPLLDLVDEKKLGLGVGGQLSYLKKRSQETVYRFCYAADPPRNLKEAQARALREVEADPDRIIDEELLEELTAVKKKVRFRTLKIEMSQLRQYFPVGTPEEVVIQTIHTALADYFEGKEDETC